MKRAKVVIGAGFGDEGKGLATDYLASQCPAPPLVVRFNGGAQAGHTVQAPGGKRHIFSHFGAASLQGAITGLSRFFVCHPILFHRERALLEELGVQAKVIVDPLAPVTSPYEVMVNQALETRRGNQRHGSCGIGFGETIEREERSPYSLRAGDIADARSFVQRLRRIRDEYIPRRLATLGLPAEMDHLGDEAILENFLEDSLAFAEAVDIRPLADASGAFPVIYEGAQGLRLDMDRGIFPHVTRSNTGLKNVAALAHEAGIGGLDVCYATRAYLSRHGAGPLPHELPEAPCPGIVDTTNVTNDWQGQLRFAWLDTGDLKESIHADLGNARGLAVEFRLLVTCLDQVDSLVTVVENGARKSIPREALPARLAAALGTDRALASYGPCRDDIVTCKAAAPASSAAWPIAGAVPAWAGTA